MYPHQPLDYLNAPRPEKPRCITPISPQAARVATDAEEFAVNDQVEVFSPSGWVAAIIVKIIYISGSERFNLGIVARFEVKYTSPRGKLVQEAVGKEKIRAGGYR